MSGRDWGPPMKWQVATAKSNSADMICFIYIKIIAQF